MRKLMIWLLFLHCALLLIACGEQKKPESTKPVSENARPSSVGMSESQLTGDEPPALQLEIDGKAYPAILGTYCWNAKGKGVCVDTAGTFDLLEGKEPINVQAGEQIVFVLDGELAPTKIELFHEETREIGREINLVNHRFTAATEPGIYYYTFVAWWLDEKDDRLTHGDAFYSFALQVE